MQQYGYIVVSSFLHWAVGTVTVLHSAYYSKHLSTALPSVAVVGGESLVVWARLSF
jgi:hypothetical protein